MIKLNFYCDLNFHTNINLIEVSFLTLKKRSWLAFQNLQKHNATVERAILNKNATTWNSSQCFLRQTQPTVNRLFPCNLKRFDERILHRLRLGIIGLNADLFRLNIHPTGKCNDCSGMETVSHFLIECPNINHSYVLCNKNVI